MRGVYMGEGNGKFMEPDAAARALHALHDYLAPDSLDAVYQDAAEFPRFGGTTQSLDESLVKFDLL